MTPSRTTDLCFGCLPSQFLAMQTKTGSTPTVKHGGVMTSPSGKTSTSKQARALFLETLLSQYATAVVWRSELFCSVLTELFTVSTELFDIFPSTVLSPLSGNAHLVYLSDVCCTC